VIAPGADPQNITLGFEGVEKLVVDANGDLVLKLPRIQEPIRFQKPLAYQESNGARKEIFSGGVFVAKLNPAGAALVYSTYLGGNGNDGNYNLTLDNSGSVYVTGFTNSTNFPTVNALQPIYGGGSGDPVLGDAFAAKLNSTGTGLVYSTYLGGSGDDLGGEIAVDANGNAYIFGSTGSEDFPTANALQPTPIGGSDVYLGDMFIMKLNQIEFQIAEFGLVSLKVYDLMGREIVALVNENLLSGKYEAGFDMRNLPGGLYFYRLKASGFTEEIFMNSFP